MEYINIAVSTFTEPSYVMATDSEKVNWISLVAWSVQRGLNGVIEDCEQWDDRVWMVACGVYSKVENCSLYYFENGNLHLNFYPDWMIKKAEAARKNGLKGGRPKAKKTNPKTNEKTEKNQLGFVGYNQPENQPENHKERKKERKKVNNKNIIINDNKKEKSKTDFCAISFDSIFELMKETMPSLSDGELKTQANAFKDHYDANGWTQNGNKPIKDWKAAARGWIRRSLRFNQPSAVKRQDLNNPSDYDLTAYHQRQLQQSHLIDLVEDENGEIPINL